MNETVAASLVVSIAALAFGMWKYLHTQLNSKADKVELDRQRDNIATLFEKVDEHARHNDELHEKVIQNMHEMHVDLLEKIGKR